MIVYLSCVFETLGSVLKTVKEMKKEVKRKSLSRVNEGRQAEN